MSDEQTRARAQEARRRRRVTRLHAMRDNAGASAPEMTTPPGPGTPHPADGGNEPQRTDQGAAPGIPASAAARVPDGYVLLDAEELSRLRTAAAEPERLAAELARERREQLVMAAIRDGRIPPARRAHWLQHLEVDHEGATTALAALPSGLIPVGDPIGHNAPEPARNDDSWFPGH